MRKIIILIQLLAFCLHMQAQDQIILLKGDTLRVSVTKVTENEIEYSFIGETMINTISPSSITRIVFASGRTQEFKPNIVIPIINNKAEWEKVIVTTNRDDVKGLTMVKSIAVVAGGSLFNSASGAHEAAITKLKKKAANLKCGIVLITKEDYGGQFRNASNMSGEAYR